MRLLERLGILIKADAHGVVESIEDRRLLAKQYVREAKLALEDKRGRLAELRNEENRLVLEAKRLATVMARVDEDVELALRENETDLARAAIRKLLPLREAERRLTARLRVLRDEQSGITERLALQEQELEVLEARLEAELVTVDASRAPGQSFDSPVVTNDDVELELLRRRQAMGSVPAGTVDRRSE